jgi:DNA polymerase III subunit alpha
MLLNCHTYYSFCYGTFSIDALMNEVKRKGYNSYVLTDINNTSACLDALRKAEEINLKVVFGIDFRIKNQQQYIGIAQNNHGFFELNEFLSRSLHNQEPLPSVAPDLNHAFFVYPLQNYHGHPLKDNEFIGVSIKDLLFLPLSPYRNLRHKMVVLHTVTFEGKKQFNAHRLLRAIDNNVLLSRLEKLQQAFGNEMLLPKQDLLDAFKEFPDVIQRTQGLLNDCHIEFEYGKLANKNLKYYTNSHHEDLELIRSLCYENISHRYPIVTDEVKNRIEKELEVIGQLKFASYFLINWDIVTYARRKDYYYVGRGSGANSILAYLLRITDVDPIELDLYFERFINLYRNNAPDFDMDFSWLDRDDITRYIFERFGKERTALLGTYSTFQHDAVIRELGKVFGLPPAEIDELQKKDLRTEIDETARLVLKYSQLIQGFPSHLSVHSSGIIISELPIHTYTATNLPPKGYPLTQFSMIEAEDIGLYKFDILSQRGLGKIKDSISIIKQNQGVDIDIHDIQKFKNDEKVKQLLKKGETIGCFYVESPAMRMLLSKLRADDYLRLVAASSIIRPGVAKSGMMRAYIVRYRHPELREKARKEIPELYDLLEETYGVMVYQEDVIKVAHCFAGLSLAESDYLRRGMSWKFKQRNEFSKVKNNFFTNCMKKGHTQQAVNAIWLQIESFANYAFSKGHSASYAVESFQALYLKAHYPLEYMLATINNGGGFYRKDLYLHEARMHGAIIKHPCINTSSALSVIHGKVIHLGLAMVAELNENVILKILEERQINGPFIDLHDAVERLDISVDQMRLLIRVNAFQFTGKDKRTLLWEVHGLMFKEQQEHKHAELFERSKKKWQIPQLENSFVDDAYDDIELLGFSICSPYELLKSKLPEHVLAKDFKLHLNQSIETYGYMINVKYLRTSNGERMYFGTFVDYEGLWIDTVHFPDSAKKYPFSGPGVYKIKAVVKEEYDFINLEVNELQRLDWVNRD